MQETKTRTPAEDMPSPRPPWIRAVAIVAALALLGGTLYATWQAVASTDDPKPDPSGLGESEPDFSLTDEQALARFTELRSAAFEATRNRDTSGLPNLFTEESPAKERLLGEIQQLKDSNVFEKSSFETISQEVTVSSSTEIRIRELVEFFPCFVSEAGDDVTVGPRGIKQDLVWTLQIEDSKWVMHNSQIQDDKRIEDQNGPCR